MPTTPTLTIIRRLGGVATAQHAWAGTAHRGPLALMALVGALACQGPPGPPDLGADCRQRGVFTDLFDDVSGESGLDAHVVSPDFRGNALIVFDADGDGRLDVLAGSRSGGVHLYINSGGLRFEDATDAFVLSADIGARAATAADLDNDGDTDVIVASRGGAVLVENLRGRFAEPVPLPHLGTTEHILTVDVDSDGLLDVFAANHDRNNDLLTQNRLLHNRGELQFEAITSTALPASPSWSWTATALDIDDDGDLDIYVANDTLTLDFGASTLGGNDKPRDALLVNESGPDGVRFVDRSIEYGLADPRSSMGGLPVDVDGDMDLDLLIPDFGANKLMLRDGNGFTDRAAALGLQAPARKSSGCSQGDANPRCLLLTWGVAAEDFDLDGEQEIAAVSGEVLATETPPPFLYFDQAGSAVYEEQTNVSGCMHGYALAPADFDGDGDLDLLVGERDGPLRLLENQSESRGSSLRLRLFGTQSNREGRGAVVTAELSDGRRLLRPMAPGGVAFTSLPAEIHFGHGSEVIESVLVQWPSGRRERFAVGEHVGELTLVEGSPSLGPER